jgi:small subunit ribosomal protein S20
MAHHKSALKSIRQEKVRRVRNKALRTQTRNAIKNVRSAIEGADPVKAKEAFHQMTSVIDSMAGKDILHKNKAARLKSRLNEHVRAITQPKQA